MTEALLISNLLLWIAWVAMALVVVALVRQIGVLHERVAPAGALVVGHGPKAGEVAPVLRVEDLAGKAHEIGGAGPDGLSTLLLFVSPTCPVCESLIPALRSVMRGERRWLRVLLASDGPSREHMAFVKDRGLERFPYLLSTDLVLTYRVGKLPYAVLIDEAGVICSQGLVNSREHLESLFEAKERGVGSIQEFLGESTTARGAA